MSTCTIAGRSAAGTAATRILLLAPLLALGLAGHPGTASAVDGASYLKKKETSETRPSPRKKASKRRSGGSLAGTEGNVRRKVLYQASMTGGCAAMHRRYVAASGHSAFASTPIDYFYGSSVCAVGLNAPSTKAAEGRALSSCRAGLKKYKSAGDIGVSGKCEIYMSK